MRVYQGLLIDRVKSFAIFWFLQVCVAYITRLKQFKTWKLPAVVGSIIVNGALTRCALLHPKCDLKDTQMNVKSRVIQELLLYMFQLGHNAAEATKTFSYAKEGTVDHSIVTRWFKKFRLGRKNLDNQTRPGRPKTVDSKTVLKVKEANPASGDRRVSGERDISQSRVVQDLRKSIWSCRIVPYVTKTLKNF